MSAVLSEVERRSILEGLESPDEEVRRLSVEQLLLLPIDEAAEHLGRALGDDGWRVRKAAVERLVACRHDVGVHDMLIRSLSDGENPGRRNAAFEALVACGREVAERLVGELSSRDVDVRKLVIDALAAIGDPQTRGPLVAVLADDDANIRAAAAEALGVVGGSAEIEQLLRVATATEEDVLVRLSALRALHRMDASVGVATLGETLEQSLLRPAGFELLGGSTDPCAVDALVKGLASGSRSSREAAIGALLRTLGRLDGIEAEALRDRLREVAAADVHLVEACCDRLEVSDLTQRMALTQFLGIVGDPRSVIPLLLAGRDEAISELVDTTLEAIGTKFAAALEEGWSGLEIDLRERACSVLGRVGGATAERLLAEALVGPDASLRCRAAMALAEGGFVDRVPDLVRRLEASAREEDADTIDEVATIVRAIVQLAEHPSATASGIDVQLIELLSSRLAGAAEPIRLAIAQVLSRLGRPQDEDVIGYLLKDESAAVRRAAVEALSRFSFEQARDAVRLALGDESGLVRVSAVGVLGELGRMEAIDDLAVQLSDEDDRVVAAAVRAIGRLVSNPTDAEGRVEGLLESALDRDALVALAALEALMEVGGEVAGRLAKRVLRRVEPDLVRAGVACLGAHGSLEDVAEAVSLVAHPDWSVRAETVQVLMDRRHRGALPALLRRLEIEDDPFVRQSILSAIERLEE